MKSSIRIYFGVFLFLIISYYAVAGQYKLSTILEDITSEKNVSTDTLLKFIKLHEILTGDDLEDLSDQLIAFIAQEESLKNSFSLGFPNYPNGVQFKNQFFGVYYSNGKPIKDILGFYYPNGQIAKDYKNFYYPNGKTLIDYEHRFLEMGLGIIQESIGITKMVPMRLGNTPQIPVNF